MTGNQFSVTEVKTFRLDHEYNEPGCARVFTVKFMGTPSAAQAAKDTPPPNVNGWRDGYCPDHAVGD